MSRLKRMVLSIGFVVFFLSVCGAEVVPGKGKGLYVKIAEVLEVPTFVVSNDPVRGYEPFMTPCFETYVPEYKYFKQFADAGTRLYSFNANASACDYGHSKQIWIEPNVWDRSEQFNLDREYPERVETLLAELKTIYQDINGPYQKQARILNPELLKNKSNP